MTIDIELIVSYLLAFCLFLKFELWLMSLEGSKTFKGSHRYDTIKIFNGTRRTLKKAGKRVEWFEEHYNDAK